DGSTNIYLPQNPSQLVFQEPLIFEEPRHVVDLTFGLLFLLKNNLQFSTGFSFPVTGGTAREIEFMSTLNYGF
ncbi:MAG: hypothetical protein IH899_13365, partial [Planctomycetes bacterium]|nr:hypothetical protein [Planctomycetota bacterium]